MQMLGRLVPHFGTLNLNEGALSPMQNATDNLNTNVQTAYADLAVICSREHSTHPLPPSTARGGSLVCRLEPLLRTRIYHPYIVKQRRAALRRKRMVAFEKNRQGLAGCLDDDLRVHPDVFSSPTVRPALLPAIHEQ